VSWTLATYVARRFAVALLGAFGAVTLLILLVNLIELLRRARGRVDVVDVATLAAFQTPQITMQVTPFVVLLASMICYAQFSRASELVVTRAAGVSAWAIVAPVAVSAVLVGGLTFAVLNPIAAATTQRFETLEARFLSGQDSRLAVSRDGLWLRQGLGEGQTVIHARASNATATDLRDVTLFQFAEQDEMSRRIDARRAELRPGHWLLSDVEERPVTIERAEIDGAGSVTRRATLAVPTELTSEQILASFAPPDSISFWSLPDFIETLEESGFSARRHRLHWHGQLALPMLFCAMALIGASFSMRHVRFGGLGFMAFGAVITGFGFYFVSDVSKALGASGAVPPMLGAWAPPMAATLFAVGLLLQTEDG
jgi:lipopolysaccharide export system permease protein